MEKIFLLIATVALLSGCARPHDRVYVVEKPVVVEKHADTDRVYGDGTEHVIVKEPVRIVPEE